MVVGGGLLCAAGWAVNEFLRVTRLWLLLWSAGGLCALQRRRHLGPKRTIDIGPLRLPRELNMPTQLCRRLRSSSTRRGQKAQEKECRDKTTH
jgi:hypothetical protein